LATFLRAEVGWAGCWQLCAKVYDSTKVGWAGGKILVKLGLHGLMWTGDRPWFYLFEVLGKLGDF